MSKYEKFCQAFRNLQDIYQYEEPYDNVVLTGMVALYKLCFEQAWKAMKELLEKSGAPEGKTGSPKLILKTAYQMNLISDEELWLQALTARNNVAHAYNQAIALDIVKETKTTYYRMFCALKDEIEENWI
ncbi:MAG: HI0074 family nucleotidyltransferase substrate-binding subunit [Lachnospiraceae bacterium]|nr:HI0074 family nucleotidyltransferase substrate-binding subunit [Lachnospiraceae bacterium]